MSDLRRLNAHRAWANGLYAEWFASLAEPEEYCLKMFSHVLRAEQVWLVRMEGGVPENRVWELVPPGDMDALRTANDAGLEAVLNAALNAALSAESSRVLRYNLFDGTPMESSAADCLTHVCTHGMYHRGQVASRAAQAGLPKVPGTDFIAFARRFP